MMTQIMHSVDTHALQNYSYSPYQLIKSSSRWPNLPRACFSLSLDVHLGVHDEGVVKHFLLPVSYKPKCCHTLQEIIEGYHKTGFKKDTILGEHSSHALRPCHT